MELSARSAVAFACMSPGVPDGQAVVLDVAQLQALLAKTFNVGLDVGRGQEPVALVRLRLAKALIGVAEANALAAESIAIERGVSTEEIAQTEALALHAAAFNGMPDPVFHLTARARRRGARACAHVRRVPWHGSRKSPPWAAAVVQGEHRAATRGLLGSHGWEHSNTGI